MTNVEVYLETQQLALKLAGYDSYDLDSQDHSLFTQDSDNIEIREYFYKAVMIQEHLNKYEMSYIINEVEALNKKTEPTTLLDEMVKIDPLFSSTVISVSTGKTIARFISEERAQFFVKVANRTDIEFYEEAINACIQDFKGSTAHTASWNVGKLLVESHE